MRIVSLVPNATEILFALGLDGQVVGVSHECDHPPAARRLPKLTGDALPPGLGTAEMDRAVAAQVESGESLYTLDEAGIAALEPDLIVTQSLCPVCAVSTEQVDRAVTPLPRCPELLSLDPERLGDVFDDIRAVGAKTGREERAERLVAELEERLERMRRAVEGRPRPRVVALEWLDPPFLGGHWVPEMIEIAGGEPLLSRPGEASRRAAWEEIAAADPDVLVAMPCGFDEAGAAAELERVGERPGFAGLRAVRQGHAYPVDANALFSRPGPRLAEGVERLAELFHGRA